MAQDCPCTIKTLGAEEKSLVGIAIGGVVSLALTGLAASMLEGTAPVRLSTTATRPGGAWTERIGVGVEANGVAS